MAPNACHSGFPTHHFVYNYTHNSKTKGCIRTFYLSNNSSTIRGIYSLGYSSMWVTISKLWVQARIATTFRYNILCLLALVTRKLQVVCGHSTYQMTALLVEMSIFCVRAGCEIQMASYTSKHTSQCLFNSPFLCIQYTKTHNLKTSGHMCTFRISNDCNIINDILCAVYSCTIDPTGELRSETRISCCLIQHCVCIL